MNSSINNEKEKIRMTCLLSTTYDDNYLFYVPITTWAWNKIRIRTKCFMPTYMDQALSAKKFDLLSHVMWGDFIYFKCPKQKESTYAQCARLYGAATPLFNDDEVLITGDIDMAVFNKEYFEQFNEGGIHVVGTDLVPDGQYPMCYIAMPTKTWRKVMDIPLGKSHQEKLDDLLGNLDCEHFRGNYWSKDQETIYNQIWLSFEEFNIHLRAKPGTQFATRRADRDGWPAVIPPDIIDAHLPRPGYTPENFAMILNLFQTMYPDDDFQWMIDYRNEYVKLLNT